jgi:putative colanic acid biosysnthesis UDP-glucose lipid carrier transferase
MPPLTRLLFIIADLLFLNLSIYLSYLTQFSRGDQVNELYLIIYSNLAWFFLVLVANPYSASKSWSLSKILKSQFVFLFIHLSAVVSLIFFFKRSYSLQQIAVVYIIFIPCFYLFKFFILYVRRIQSKEVIRNFIIIGRNDISFGVRKYYLQNPAEKLRFLRYFDFNADYFFVEEIERFCEGNDVHLIFCCVPNVSESQLNQLVNFGLDSLISVKIVLDAQSTKAIQIDEQKDLRDIAIIPLDESRNQLVKRIFDLVFTILFCVIVLSWLFPLIALLIKLDSRGPVFFVQQRNGLKNIPFGCIKFRTMVVNQESDTKQATKDDSRITRLGKFLRKSSIDEFPQFINVLIGDMSLIGPRPHMIKHNEQYSKVIEKFLGRHYVKPGITGLAQCMGYRGETKDLSDMENRVRLDRYYIENWTFWLDLKIVFLTVVSLLRGSEKAY